MHSRTRSLFIAILCVLMCTAVFAQSGNSTTGSIAGRVTDSSGGALPGVTLTATNLDTGLTRTEVTASNGDYSFTLLQTGRYRVDAELSGLGKAASPTLTVVLGSTTRADIKLSPQVTESITVTAGAPIVDTQKSGTTASVSNRQIENLPLLGRDFKSLAALTPGITAGAFDTTSITANGARPLSTDYNIDGASSNNDFFGQQTGGTNPPFTFSQAAIKEFQVIRTQYDAEYGRGVGATVNAITKSGTNDIDGEAFYFLRKDAWASSRPGTIGGLIVTDSFRSRESSQPGFAVGGPVVRDKIFFFANFDGQHQKLPIAISGTSNMLTSANFLALSAANQQAVLDKIQTNAGASYASGLGYDQTFNDSTYLLKFDGSLGSKNHWSFRDNVTKFTKANSQAITVLGLNQTQEIDKFYQAVVEGDTVVSSSMYNQFIAQSGRDQRPVTALGTGTEFSINWGSTQFFGANDITPNTADEKKFQVKDTVQYVWKDHTLKIGGELLHRNLFDSFPRFAGGMYAFTSLTNFLSNTANTFQQAYGPQNGDVAWKTNLWGYFFNDSFHIGSRLTVDAGVRYDYEKTPRPAANAFPQHPEFLNQINDDKNNIAPRFGFAFDTLGNGRSVLRGGVGKFFEYMPDILLASPIQGISGALITSTFTCTTTPANPCPTGGFPNIFTPAQFLASGAKLSANLVTIGSDYQAQEATRMSLQYEQQLGSSYSAAIGGIYSKLNHVQGTRNINVVPTGTLLGNMPVYDYNSSANPNRPYADLGIIREITSNEQAWYRSQTIEFHKQAFNDAKFSWDLSYTHSGSVDMDTNTRSTSTTFLIDPKNPALSEGTSDNDITHRVVGDLTYHLPYGIQVSGIAFWHSGLPYTGAISFTCSGCTATSITGQPQTTQAASFTPVWINSSGGVIDLTLANGFTQAQFASFLASQGGHLLGRNTFRQPAVWDADVRVSKNFNITHGMQLQLIGEAFNLFNNSIGVVTGANQDLYRVTYTQSTGKYTIIPFTNNIAPAGQPANIQNTFTRLQGYSSETDPRQYQVAAKIIF